MHALTFKKYPGSNITYPPSFWNSRWSPRLLWIPTNVISVFFRNFFGFSCLKCSPMNSRFSLLASKNSCLNWKESTVKSTIPAYTALLINILRQIWHRTWDVVHVVVNILTKRVVICFHEHTIWIQNIGLSNFFLRIKSKSNIQFFLS